MHKTNDVANVYVHFNSVHVNGFSLMFELEVNVIVVRPESTRAKFNLALHGMLV